VNVFPALSLMERHCPPLRHGREPYWRAPVTAPSAEVYIPTWNWRSVNDIPEGTEVVDLDANAAYLGALGNVKIAYSELERMGPWEVMPTPRQVTPGYYKISVPYWAFSGTVVHPLGDSTRLQEETTLWVAAPTLVLLLELLDTGHLGPFTILDSWTTPVVTNFTAWADRLKSVRREVMDKRDHAHQGQVIPPKCECDSCARYGAFKEGYSMAFSMMLTGERCKARRPDWSHTVYAEHAASQWRKAWRYTFTGLPIVRMGEVDEITVMSADLHTALARPKPPFRFDASGRAVGAFKPKRTYPYTAEPTAPTTAPTAALDEDDIF
jgi:hypothetical protein